jgi:uncharacterized protein YggU (UPF0235/DUF167 family)
VKSDRVPPAVLHLTIKPGVKQPGFQREGTTVVLRVRERALEGAANAACIQAIARFLDVAPSRVTLVRGHRGRQKAFAVDGLDQPTLDARLASLP